MDASASASAREVVVERGQPGHHRVERVPHRLVQVRAEPERHPPGRRLGVHRGQRPLGRHRDDRLGRHAALDRRAARLAVALRGVPVAEVEQRAVDVDRQVEGRAGGELLAVDVPARLGPRRHRRVRRPARPARPRSRRGTAPATGCTSRWRSPCRPARRSPTAATPARPRPARAAAARASPAPTATTSTPSCPASATRSAPRACRRARRRAPRSAGSGSARRTALGTSSAARRRRGTRAASGTRPRPATAPRSCHRIDGQRGLVLGREDVHGAVRRGLEAVESHTTDYPERSRGSLAL